MVIEIPSSRQIYAKHSGTDNRQPVFCLEVLPKTGTIWKKINQTGPRTAGRLYNVCGYTVLIERCEEVARRRRVNFPVSDDFALVNHVYVKAWKLKNFLGPRCPSVGFQNLQRDTPHYPASIPGTLSLGGNTWLRLQMTYGRDFTLQLALSDINISMTNNDVF